MCPSLQGDETPRYLCKCFFHRFRCRGHFLFQNDFPRFIPNAVARPLIAEVQTNRELLPFENHVSIYPNNASLLHSRSPFLLRHERVEHWERIASRGRPAFSSHLVNRVLVQVPVTGYVQTGFAEMRTQATFDGRWLPRSGLRDSNVEFR